MFMDVQNISVVKIFVFGWEKSAGEAIERLFPSMFIMSTENFQFCLDDDFQCFRKEAAARELAVKSHRLNSKGFYWTSSNND